MLYYDGIGVSEGIHSDKTNESKSAIFATIGISQIKGLSFNEMYVIGNVMY